MTRYATAEEKITCKNCTVEFTEREFGKGRTCPSCFKNPFRIFKLRVRTGVRIRYNEIRARGYAIGADFN
ncbi:hypothetical protein LCGC14_0887210 [marine sediment metagenome]|uniref:Uncharacterized protein n=1 Tax=marine sediment metagenome TaxID=412755 RepID=A0A0F9P068_9ZZZZ